MVTMQRAKPVSSGSDVAAFLELAKDPAAFAAKLEEYNAASDRAEALIAESKLRDADVGEKLNALNARETALVKRETALAEGEASLADAAAALKANTDAANAALASRGRAVSARENDVTDREQVSAQVERDLASARTALASDQAAAQQMRDEYQAKLEALRAIVCPGG